MPEYYNDNARAYSSSSPSYDSAPPVSLEQLQKARDSFNERLKIIEILPNKGFKIPDYIDLPFLETVPPSIAWNYLAKAVERRMGDRDLAVAIPSCLSGEYLSVNRLQKAGIELGNLAFMFQAWERLWITADDLLEADITGEPFRSSIKPEPFRSRKQRKHELYTQQFNVSFEDSPEPQTTEPVKEETVTKEPAKEPTNRNKTEALDPGWGAGFDDNYFETQDTIRDGLKEVAPDFFNLSLNFVPIIGDFKGLAEAITGKDIAGNELAVGRER